MRKSDGTGGVIREVIIAISGLKKAEWDGHNLSLAEKPVACVEAAVEHICIYELVACDICKERLTMQGETWNILIFMNDYYLDQVPFDDTYVHCMVCRLDGWSKSEAWNAMGHLQAKNNRVSGWLMRFL